MKKPMQQPLPLKTWGGARKGAGRKRRSARRNVPHRARKRFRRAAIHVAVRLRHEVWNLRTHRCFRALRRAFAGGCARFGFRPVHFSVQGNHVHMIVEAPDAETLGCAMKGLEVRVARRLNRVMNRRGPVFADRYHAHILRTPSEAARAVSYVLENFRVHGERGQWAVPSGIDPFCSTAWMEHAPPLTLPPAGWMLLDGLAMAANRRRDARPANPTCLVRASPPAAQRQPSISDSDRVT
ncbi:MAG TPA: transposase [Myxococcales bacterium]|nr:transposase [Myxococcales bacterium]